MSGRLNLTAARLLTVGWGLLCVALLALLGFESGWGEHVRLDLPVPGGKRIPQSEILLQMEFGLPPVADFSAIAARPIFVPGRQPPPVPAPPKPAMQKGQFVLMGALMTGGKNIALLREVATGKSRRIEQGKEINGIAVAQVEPNKVTLTQYDESEVLPLKIQSSPKPAPPPQASLPQAAVSPAPGVAGSAPVVDSNPQSLLNRRRVLRGLPPI
ncbi:MAG: hypothetical protein Q8O37_00320 [Sulfuricellaceae bacterium]|nr:hypothetical protein [Sulfuricellaceae bacterium]